MVYEDFKIDKAKNPNKFESQLIKDGGFIELLPATAKKEGVLNSPAGEAEEQKIAAFSIIPSFQGKIFVISPINNFMYTLFLINRN